MRLATAVAIATGLLGSAAGASDAASAAHGTPARRPVAVYRLTPGAARTSADPRTAVHGKPTAGAAGQRVIVLLKAQFHQALAGSRASVVRADEIRAEQRPLLAELRAAHARAIRPFTLIDSFAVTVSAAERARLAANPAVAEVIPDATISLGPASAAANPLAFRSETTTATTSAPSLNNINGACSANQNAPLLDPEGLSLTDVDSDSPTQSTARSLGITGAGVKVAWIADGIDPNNANLIRPDGTSVFSPGNGGDYEDFSGDGPGMATNGDEAFIDANTIAGQGLVAYNVQDFSAQSDSTACWIRIEGVAPGASLVGLDVTGSYEDTTESNFLQAINYAVQTDHVNVINESFGSVNFPDETALDVTKQFNDAAVAAGVFISVATGDAGPFNTIGSPSSDPLVTSVGASTDYRFYAQTNYAATRYFATGWADGDNQISALSSSGFEQSGGTVDLVAPGDLSFASCDASAEFSGCTNFLGQPSSVEESGGTSESAPFVAGAAALIIQAYRQTHNGATPSPAVVGQILTSTATDITAPGQEQGAGLLDAYKAVELAESIPGSSVTPAPTGNTLLVSSTQLNATGYPGVSHSFQETVTNTGATTQTVNLSTRTYGPPRNIQSHVVQLQDATGQQFENYAGVANNWESFPFTVPSGASRLVGQVAWPVNPTYCLTQKCNGDLNSRVRMILVDPNGDIVANSLPQGSGSYGTTEVNDPVPGPWTGYIFGDVATAGGTNGQVTWRVSTEAAESFGSLSTSQLTLAPGQSQTFTYTVPDASLPGDTGGSVLLNTGTPGSCAPQGSDSCTSIPVTVRTLVNPSQGGRFYGRLTGGNGRPVGEGQEQYYQFDVTSNVTEIMANLRFSNDASDPVAEYLVSPDGDTVGYGQNSAVTSSGMVPSMAESAYALHPAPGRWTLIVAFGEPTVGNEVSEPYWGQVRFVSPPVWALQVPHSTSTTLVAGQPVTVPVLVLNTGASTQDYFVDPRLTATENLSLAPLSTGTPTLPLTGAEPSWVVPSETSSVTVTSTAAVPSMFDYEPLPGDPDLASSSPGSSSLCSTTATGTYTPAGGFVTPGVWEAGPTMCGPYPAFAPNEPDTIGMTATTQTFDQTVTSTTGDAWLGAINPGATFTPLVLDAGHEGTIDVTFTPQGAAGSTVSGTLYVDTLEGNVPPPAYGQSTGDEIAAIPYTYTIAASG